MIFLIAIESYNKKVLHEICLKWKLMALQVSYKTLAFWTHDAWFTRWHLITWLSCFDVWWGVWRCTHAKVAPLTPHPLVRDRHCGPASGQRGERFGAGNLSALISHLLLKCADGATTLSLHFGIDQDLGISGLYGELAAWCLQSGPAWIVFFFRCLLRDFQKFTHK